MTQHDKIQVISMCRSLQENHEIETKFYSFIRLRHHPSVSFYFIYSLLKKK